MEEETTTRERFGRQITDLAGEFGTLLCQEAALARCELAEAAQEAKAGAAKCGIGIGMAMAGMMAVTAGAVLGLTLLLRQWMSTLEAAAISSAAVGVLMGVIALLLFRQGGRSFNPERFVPRRALESLKEDLRWARERM